MAEHLEPLPFPPNLVVEGKWNDKIPYRENHVVLSGCWLYVALQDTIGNDPSKDLAKTFWRRFDEQDKEIAWGEFLHATQMLDLWPHTDELAKRRNQYQANTPSANRARINALRALETGGHSYAPQKRRSVA